MAPVNTSLSLRRAVVCALVLLLVASPAFANISGTVAFTNGVCLHVRTGPGTRFDVINCIAEGTVVDISCSIVGENINGDRNWDYLHTLRGFASDAYINTGLNIPSPC